MLTRKQTLELANTLLIRAILTELVNDDRYPCHCGDDPYTDGELCPKCAALMFLKQEGAKT